jgi:ribosomal protein S18 acetylase RimI-like enzyme
MPDAATCRVADYGDAEDAETVSTLLNGYAMDQFGNSAPLDDAVRASLCTHLSKVPGAFSVIASVGATPVGLINAFQGFSTFSCKPLINVHDVFVAPAHRRKGITQLMLEKVQEIAVERDCCKITLEVLSNNPNAMGSYEKFGFKSYELDPTLGTAQFWEKKLT